MYVYIRRAGAHTLAQRGAAAGQTRTVIHTLLRVQNRVPICQESTVERAAPTAEMDEKSLKSGCGSDALVTI